VTGNFRVVFVSPLYNAAGNFIPLIKSIGSQHDPAWEHWIIDDMSTDNPDYFIGYSSEQKRHLIRNAERKYALRNIVEVARKYQDEPNTIIATVDGDDQLCNDDTVSILRKAYESGADVVWTAHRWDTNGMNISRPMPSHVDPYAWPWSSSHLRTFRASLLKQVSDANFKDHNGEWFKRGYDQALMLPLLSLTKNRLYVPDVCYLYNIDSKSIPASERNYSERAQLSTVNFVRARGFVK
jgi:glycosyltransferase involved in cell wall biosynthesis